MVTKKTDTSQEVAEDAVAAEAIAAVDSQPKTLADVAGPRVSRFLVMTEEEMQLELAKEHKFWSTQPVAKIASETEAIGPLDRIKTVEEVRQTPYVLPEDFSWVECDLLDDVVLQEVHTLLCNNYVEDDDAFFRFRYSKEFLRWGLTPQGYHKDWIVGVRYQSRLVAFITGIPIRIFVHDRVIDLAEINFLCVHKQLRQRRLAPLLIREITRRVNIRNIWQAVYTAGIVLSRPLAKCRYYHRALNIEKLIEVGFSRLPPRQTLSMNQRLMKLPEKSMYENFRKMEEKDVPAVTKLLEEYHKAQNRLLYIIMSEEDVRHWILPRDDVVFSYVLENDKGEATDFVSFYSLPSTVIKKNEKYNEIKGAYSFYTVANTIDLKELMLEGLIRAHDEGFDVFNALDLGSNSTYLRDLKFGLGDGFLRYYLYNWGCPEMRPRDVGLIML